jgi:dTDP-glucose pyrophosphorylase
VQFDKKNNVINIKEKIIISNFASSGLYFFKSSDLLLKELVKGTGLGETYFSHLINRMIKNKFSVTCNKISPKNKTIILGTPEQYISEIQKN